MTRVLFVGQSYIAAESRKKLACLANRPDLDVSLIVPTTWEHESFGRYVFQLAKLDARISIYPISIRHNGRPFAFSYAFIPLARAVRAIQPEVMQVEQEPGSLALAQFVLLKHILRHAKLIGFTWENLFYRQPGIRHLLEKIELAQLDYLLVGSSGSANIFRQKKYQGPLAILPNVGVDTEHFSPRANSALRETLGLRARFVVGFVGRLVSDKGCMDLLNAFAQLSENSHLLFVGDGALRDELVQRAHTTGIESRVTFQPTVPHDRVTEFMNGMDCLVLPSRTMPKWREQFGLVLAQAMACGVPVIGSDSGAIPEVIGDAGLIFPEGDVNALRDALARLRDHPELRAELSAKGRARVMANYTHARIADKTYSIYEELLRK